MNNLVFKKYYFANILFLMTTFYTSAFSNPIASMECEMTITSTNTTELELWTNYTF